MKMIGNGYFRLSINYLIFLILLSLMLAFSKAFAHPVNVMNPQEVTTKAEVHIEDGRIRLILEIDQEDARLFARLLPTELLASDSQDVTEDSRQVEEQRQILQPENIQQFATQDFQFIDEGGNPLQAKLLILESRLRLARPPELTKNSESLPAEDLGLFSPPEFKNIIYAELEYTMPQRLTRLTIVPPSLESLPVDDVLTEDASDNVLDQNAQIGFIAYHKDQPINDFNYLTGKEILELDWQDTWYTHFVNSELVRHDAIALASYLHINPTNIRHYIIVRVKDLGSLLKPDLTGKQFIDIEEWEVLKQRIGEFVSNKSPLSDDANLLQPELDQVQFVEFDETGGVRLLEKPKSLDMTQATAGVALIYEIDAIPEQLKLEWQLFSEKMSAVPVTVNDPSGRQTFHQLTAENSELVWKKSEITNTPTEIKALKVDLSTHYKIPIASVICLILLIPVAWWLSVRHREDQPIHLQLVMAGLLLWAGGALAPYWQTPIPKPPGLAPVISEQESTELLRDLLNNVYQTLNGQQEEVIRTGLSRNISSDVLEKVYQQLRRSLQNDDNNGAAIRVAAIELEKANAKALAGSSLGFVFDARWKISMAGGQWDQAQTYNHLLNAVIEVAPVDGLWKITGFDLLDEPKIEGDESAS